MSTQRPLRLAEMSRSLGVRSDWLRSAADSGRLPHLRAGDTYLFDRETVVRILSERAKRPSGCDEPSISCHAEGLSDA